MSIEIQQINEPHHTDTKRFYYPAIVRSACPKCGLVREQDGREWYFSYPTLNTPQDLNFDCYHEVNEDGEWADKGCGHNWKEKIILRLIIEPVEDAPAVPRPTGQIGQ